jgi:hypothetical protein
MLTLHCYTVGQPGMRLGGTIKSPRRESELCYHGETLNAERAQKDQPQALKNLSAVDRPKFSGRQSGNTSSRGPANN